MIFCTLFTQGGSCCEVGRTNGVDFRTNLAKALYGHGEKKLEVNRSHERAAVGNFCPARPVATMGGQLGPASGPDPGPTLNLIPNCPDFRPKCLGPTFPNKQRWSTPPSNFIIHTTLVTQFPCHSLLLSQHF